MDPVSLTLGGLVAALVARAVDTAGGQAAERLVAGAGHVLSRLVERLRAQFGDRSDDGAVTALEKVEEVPDSPRRLAALAEAVDRNVAEDAQFRTELLALVGEAKRAGADVTAIAQSAWGNQNVQIADVAGSDLNIAFGGPSMPERS